MIHLHDIEKTIASLPPEGLAEFRAWFEAFDADHWDRQLAEDITAGRLDSLAAQALEEFEKGQCKKL